MARMGLVIVIGAIIGSMVLANYVYTQYQTNFIEMDAGETVTVGPVELHLKEHMKVVKKCHLKTHL